jgi:anti-sigma B factor antagonist
VEELQIESISGGPNGVRILRLAGPFTLRTLFDFQSIAREGNEPTTLIDLTDVPYIDSAALGCLMGVHVSSKRLNRRYALVGASDRLMSLFNMCGVDEILVTYPTLDEAQKAMSAKANCA